MAPHGIVLPDPLLAMLRTAQRVSEWQAVNKCFLRPMRLFGSARRRPLPCIRRVLSARRGNQALVALIKRGYLRRSIHPFHSLAARAGGGRSACVARHTVADLCGSRGGAHNARAWPPPPPPAPSLPACLPGPHAHAAQRPGSSISMATAQTLTPLSSPLRSQCMHACSTRHGSPSPAGDSVRCQWVPDEKMLSRNSSQPFSQLASSLLTNWRST
jgi:hypothetical protein